MFCEVKDTSDKAKIGRNFYLSLVMAMIGERRRGLRIWLFFCATERDNHWFMLENALRRMPSGDWRARWSMNGRIASVGECGGTIGHANHRSVHLGPRHLHLILPKVAAVHDHLTRLQFDTRWRRHLSSRILVNHRMDHLRIHHGARILGGIGRHLHIYSIWNGHHVSNVSRRRNILNMLLPIWRLDHLLVVDHLTVVDQVLRRWANNVARLVDNHLLESHFVCICHGVDHLPVLVDQLGLVNRLARLTLGDIRVGRNQLSVWRDHLNLMILKLRTVDWSNLLDKHWLRRTGCGLTLSRMSRATRLAAHLIAAARTHRDREHPLVVALLFDLLRGDGEQSLTRTPITTWLTTGLRCTNRAVTHVRRRRDCNELLVWCSRLVLDTELDLGRLNALRALDYLLRNL